jgi:hypothetical protein
MHPQEQVAETLEFQNQALSQNVQLLFAANKT